MKITGIRYDRRVRPRRGAGWFYELGGKVCLEERYPRSRRRCLQDPQVRWLKVVMLDIYFRTKFNFIIKGNLKIWLILRLNWHPTRSPMFKGAGKTSGEIATPLFPQFSPSTVYQPEHLKSTFWKLISIKFLGERLFKETPRAQKHFAKFSGVGVDALSGDAEYNKQVALVADRLDTIIATSTTWSTAILNAVFPVAASR